MKLTINMGDEILDKVVAIRGASTKTEAIHIAHREVVRRARLVELLREGTGACPSRSRSRHTSERVLSIFATFCQDEYPKVAAG
jgi:Arc/MetJ family transcription regulator